MPMSLPGKATDAGILFLDVKGYSRLEEIDLSCFHKELVPHLATVLFPDGYPDWVLYSNTWGDGVVMISADYIQLARAALKMKSYFNYAEYGDHTGHRLRRYDLGARIAMHAGLFYSAHDPFRRNGDEGYFGRTMILAARIEPVTTPRHVWITEEAKIRITGHCTSLSIANPFRFSEKGPIELAKAFGTENVWDLGYYDTDQSQHDGSAPAATKLPGPTPDPVEDPNGDPEGERLSRIRAVFGSALDRSALRTCELRSSDSCVLPFSSLSLAAELMRSTEVLNTTHECVRHFHRLSDLMRHTQQAIEIGRDVPQTYRKAMILRRSLQDLKHAFARPGRKCEAPCWKDDAWHRLQLYFETRLPFDGDVAIVSHLEHVETTLLALSRAGPADRVNLLQEVGFTDSVDLLARVFGGASLQLKSLPATIHKKTLLAVTGPFRRDPPSSPSQSMEAAFTALPHNERREVPRIWRERP